MFWKAALNYSFVDEILRCNQSNDFKKNNPRHIQTSDSMTSDELLFSWLVSGNPTALSTG